MIHWFRKAERTGKAVTTINDELANLLGKINTKRRDVFLQSHYVWDYPFIIQNMNIVPDLKILDAGGGHGALQFYLARRKCQVWNVDRNDFYREIMKMNKMLDTKVTFVQERLHNTAFDDNFFDYVVSCSALEHNKFEDTVKVLTELKRILKPGGKLIMTLVGWEQDLGYNEFEKNDWVEVYTEEKIKQLISESGFVPAGNSDSKAFLFSAIQFYQSYPGYNHPWIPVGVIAKKEK